MELPPGSATVAFADDLGVVVSADTDDILVEKVNWTLELINGWMLKNELALAPQKTEAIILRGPRKREQIKFRPAGISINPSRSL